MLEGSDLSDLSAIWFQPGSFNDEIIEMAKQQNPNVVHGHCVLVEAPPKD
jgi:predicted CoA-binding protein